jgi:hypothetical protein
MKQKSQIDQTNMSFFSICLSQPQGLQHYPKGGGGSYVGSSEAIYRRKAMLGGMKKEKEKEKV